MIEGPASDHFKVVKQKMTERSLSFATKLQFIPTDLCNLYIAQNASYYLTDIEQLIMVVNGISLNASVIE